MSQSRVSGLLFLALSVGYGYVATGIPTLPIDQFEAMTARSLPFFLSGLGVVLSLVMIFSAPVESADDASEPEVLAGDWPTVIKLLAAVVIYGLVLDWVGFLVASVLFLAAGFLILGERRLPVIAGVSLSLVAVLWLILVPGLEIYLAPGRLFLSLFGSG